MPLSMDFLKRLILEELAEQQQQANSKGQQPASPTAPEPSSPPAPASTSSAATTGAPGESPVTAPGPSGTEPMPGTTDMPPEGSEGSLDGGMGGTGDTGSGGPGEEGDLEGGDDLDGGDTGGGGFGGLGGIGGGGGGGGGSDTGGGEPGEPGDGAPGLTPPNEPEKRPDDPMGAVMDAATETAGKTTDVQLITNAVKASIQANFKDYQDAWPLVQQLKDTKDTTLSAVADRVSLFIAGVLHEELQRETFKETIQETKTMVKITKEELQKLVKEAVRKKLMAEQHSLFDTHRAQIEQERKAIESQMNSTEIREMAIDVFEKLCGKCGVPSENLSPETMEVVNKELKRMQYAIQEIANVLTQTATVINAASGEKK